MEKIVIIKLGALGDVVRTLSILPSIKEKYPDSEITWITKKNVSEIFKNNPYVNKVLTLEDKVEGIFDILYNFDIEQEATSLAKSIEAEKKFGFYAEREFPMAFNFPAEYYLNTLFDDDIKRTNKKTYQEIMFEVAELEYKKQHCPISLSEGEKNYANKFIEENKVDQEKLIGIHIGSSPRWPSKAWHPDRLKEFIERLSQKGYEVLLFGGPEEVTKIQQLHEEFKDKIRIHKQDPKCSILEFASLINICKKIICFDSLALHIALALKKQTICLFFCTPPDEVEGYGLLKKIVSPMLYDFFPEKMNQYSEELVKSISVEEVIKEL